MPHPDAVIAELEAERENLASDDAERAAAIDDEIAFHDSRERPAAVAETPELVYDRNAVVLAELKAELESAGDDRRDQIVSEIEAIEAAPAEEADVTEEAPVETRKRVRGGRKGKAERATKTPDETATNSGEGDPDADGDDSDSGGDAGDDND